jgi:hypothetical protein
MQPVTRLSNDVLEREIAQYAQEITRRMARWLQLVAEHDRRGGARRWGFRGTGEWLSWCCGISPRAARDHVRVARALTERPQIAAAFAAGMVSYSKVRALTRVSLQEDETALLEIAARTTASGLERYVAQLRSAPSGSVDAANEVHARRHVH